MFPSPVSARLVRVTLLAFAASLHAGGSPAESGVPPSLGTDLVLQLGPAEISRYAVEKNLARFQRAGNGGRSPSTEATRRWFELYLARQVMIAEALSQGYDRRPEVLQMVDRMERHMLAQAEPPVDPPTGVELHMAYERWQVPPGRTKPPFEEARSTLERKLLQDRRLAVRQAKRAAALQAVNLEIAHGIADQLFQRIRAEPPSTAEISERLVAPLAGEHLATYRVGDDTVTITVAAWSDRFNQLFVREIPTSTAQLEAGIQDLAVADYAAHGARSRGVDREPRFVEDRRNFLYYQALDLFEKERLRPRVEVTGTETEAYYREHPAEFARPVRARGKLLRFPDPATAIAWLRHRGAAQETGEEIEVSPLSPIPGAAGATGHILRMADGEPSGPIPVTDGVVVFLKRNTATEPEPHAAVAERIRAKLAQPKLEALELKLAGEWAPRYSIEDNLHPEEFGIEGPIQKPWAVPK